MIKDETMKEKLFKKEKPKKGYNVRLSVDLISAFTERRIALGHKAAEVFSKMIKRYLHETESELKK